jgi:predicted MFS family arabinose efflux permease
MAVGQSEAAVSPGKGVAAAVGVVALCFAINMADGIDVTILSFIAPRLQADWRMGSDVMGRLFSAGLLGIAIGGMAIAPLADRFGRRRIILAALALMSAGMVASAYASGPVALFALRVVVGTGIGTALATMAALAAESAPPGARDLAVGMVQAGYPFAAVFTGLAVARLLPLYGWRSLLGGAGLVTVVLLPAAWLALPKETARRDHGERGGGVGVLFSREYRPRTLALWAAVFTGLMVLYFIVSWITKLSIQAGLSETNGIYAGALYNLGAFVGTAAMSVLALRTPLGRLVPVMLIGAAAAMLAFGSLHLSLALALGLAFAIGVLLQGGYNGVWPLAAGAYPQEIRATGVGWAIGFGRSGAIIGPMLGGYLIDARVSLPLLFAAYCVPLLACAVSAFLVGPQPRRR